MSSKTIKEKLSIITDKKNIILTKRGNRSILLALRHAKSKGYNDIYFANQGSWITYEQYSKKLKFRLHRLMTEKGLIKFHRIKENSVVIFNDMPSYAFLQNEFNPEELKEKNVLSIGDITGSIGTRECKADILVCSFGEHKMVNYGGAGCMATNLELNIEDEFEGDEKILEQKIDLLASRIIYLRKRREEIIKVLGKDNIIKYDKEGINILTKKDEKIIKFCEENNLPYKLCPMTIKIVEPAISIEIQELEEK